MLKRSLIPGTLLISLLFSLLTLAQDNTGWLNPSQNAGGFNDPTYAYLDGGGVASITTSDVHQYWGYGVALDPSSLIAGIEVRIDAEKLTSHVVQFAVELSWDGGVSWTTTSYVTSGLSTVESTHILGAPDDTWGRTWTASDFNDNNFRVRLSVVGKGMGTIANLDWVPVKVYYTTPQLMLSTTSVGFGDLTAIDYDNGYKELSPAQTLYITSSVGWVVTVKAASSTWAYTGGEPDPLKLCTALEWKSTSSDPAVTATNTTYTGMTTTDVQVAAGNPGENIDVQMHFKLLLSYEDDPGGNYSLSFVYTLTSN